MVVVVLGGALVVVVVGLGVVVVVGRGTVVVVVEVVLVVVVAVAAADAGLANVMRKATVTPAALTTAAARRGERDITRQPSAIRPGRRRTCPWRGQDYQWSAVPGIAAGETWLNVQAVLRFSLPGRRPQAQARSTPPR